MARHWSAFCRVSEKQGIALDRIARDHGLADGMALLQQLTGNSRSRIGKMDYASLRPYLDEAFALRDAPAKEESRDDLTRAVEEGFARVNGEAVAIVDAKLQAIAQIKALMAQHGIAQDELCDE